MIMVEDNEDFVISCSKSDLGISGLNVVVIWSFYEKNHMTTTERPEISVMMTVEDDKDFGSMFLFIFLP